MSHDAIGCTTKKHIVDSQSAKKLEIVEEQLNRIRFENEEHKFQDCLTEFIAEVLKIKSKKTNN